MNREQLNQAIASIKTELGTESFLEELLAALNNDELTENLEHIARMWDIDIN